MGLFSSLFGGSKTTVTQAASNTTNTEVSIDLQNIIDLSGIERVLEYLGIQNNENTQAIVASNYLHAMVQEQKAAAEQQQQAAILNKITPWAKWLAAAALLYLGVATYRKAYGG